MELIELNYHRPKRKMSFDNELAEVFDALRPLDALPIVINHINKLISQKPKRMFVWDSISDLAVKMNQSKMKQERE